MSEEQSVCLSMSGCMSVCVCVCVLAVHSSPLHRRHKGAICKWNSASNDTGNHLNLLKASMKGGTMLVEVEDQKRIKWHVHGARSASEFEMIGMCWGGCVPDRHHGAPSCKARVEMIWMDQSLEGHDRKHPFPAYNAGSYSFINGFCSLGLTSYPAHH